MKISNLLDSAFLYIEKGGEKDDGGRTTPRSLRHFPVKDESGKYNLAYVRDAISCAPHTKGKNGKSLSAATVKRVQNDARRILKQLTKATGCLAVKSLTDEDRIGGYLIWWGDEKSQDLVDQHFTPETDFWLSEKGWLHGVWDRIPMLYHHGYNPALQGSKSHVGHWDHHEKDEIGLWVEGELKKRHEYREAVDALLGSDDGLALSSGAFPRPKAIEIEPNGFIKTWAIMEGSLTPMPMEPRMANVNYLKSVLKLDIDLSAIESADNTPKKEGKMKDKEKEAKGLIQALLKLFGGDGGEPEPTEEPAEEPKATEADPTESPDPLKALPMDEIAVAVSEAATKAINEIVTGFKAELQGFGTQIEDFGGQLVDAKSRLDDFEARLRETEKVAEAKVAEIMDRLPPVATTVRTTETSATEVDPTASPHITQDPKMAAIAETVQKLVGDALVHLQTGSIE